MILGKAREKQKARGGKRRTGRHAQDANGQVRDTTRRRDSGKIAVPLRHTSESHASRITPATNLVEARVGDPLRASRSGHTRRRRSGGCTSKRAARDVVGCEGVEHVGISDHRGKAQVRGQVCRAGACGEDIVVVDKWVAVAIAGEHLEEPNQLATTKAPKRSITAG